MTRVPFNKPSIVSNEIAYLTQAIELGQLSGDGHFTKLANKEICRQTGAHATLLTHSCTAALEMCAILSDLGPGDEVIMPSFTFVSTANAVVLRGATPVFVDIDPLTLNIDVSDMAAAITDRTRAVFVVHYAGYPADMDPILDICRAHGLIVIEDAAQALGSFYKGRPAGSLADMGAFSFHETKNIISGEGGALTLTGPRYVERAEIIREKGTNRSNFLRGQTDKYTWVDLGSSFLPGELTASFLFAQLELAETIRATRLALFERYMDAFAPLEAAGRLRRPICPEGCTGNGHIFYLMLNNIEDRDAFIRHMRAHEITTPFHYVPLHSSPAGIKFGRSNHDLPVTNDVSARLVRLPLYYELGPHIDRVIEVAYKYLSQDPG
ncbi:dTDP-4-amino-4,6-dideoxygalactose transaminase (plasmid) [Pseudorhodobacter turbinis]|uniref:dTDP-4-amino-4,6-dideoxygalactose transaminase n=1 Tax=Pseudorhodobacter turbinis TaxID=2500533 RepID=A0A4P8EMR1_9RHOB|nr:dTDP-4-amino-4,6-dideoxygalactose transaminase [Pseudorhodobacter turbinis]QCO58125.1 dTDP-4-amino-4,6-dideoxygalactose transaminase [Pseudorhodobacter turbinis]